MIEIVITLTKRTRVIVLLEGNLCNQRNSSFCLTCDQGFSFSGKVIFPSPPKQKGRRIAWSQVTFCPDLLAHRGRIKRLLLVKKQGGSLWKRSKCDGRIQSLASPPYFTTLFNYKCECILHGSTVEPRYNEVIRMTNNFLYPSNSKIVVLSISTVTLIKPATFPSTVKRSPDFPWNMPIVGFKYRRLPIIRTFKGNRKKFELSGAWRK